MQEWNNIFYSELALVGHGMMKKSFPKNVGCQLVSSISTTVVWQVLPRTLYLHGL
jgi:hypothetical protein